jgi:hypothetical protein
MTSSTEHIALFLGAGASHHFGAPLTRQILPRVVSRLQLGSLFPDGENRDGRDQAEKCRQLKDCLEDLMPGLIGADLTRIPISSVFSVIDYSLTGSFLPTPVEKIEKLHRARVLLERAILEVIDRPHTLVGTPNVPDDLARLARWLHGVGNRDRLSIISTNYDEIIETELYRQFIHASPTEKRPFDAVNRSVNFGVSWRDAHTRQVFHPPQGARHSVFKLHGCLNWLTCESCGWVTCNDELALTHTPAPTVSPTRSSENTCDCGHWPLRSVVIAPSLVRDIRDINMLGIWKAALEDLRTATRWFIIGYSLPEEDHAIRSMLRRALSTRGERARPTIEIFQKSDPETEARYRSFLGAGVTYHTTGMEGFIESVVDSA